MGLTDPKALGILFKGEMVRAILNSKTLSFPPEAIDPKRPFKGVTRRLIKFTGMHKAGEKLWRKSKESGRRWLLRDSISTRASGPHAWPGIRSSGLPHRRRTGHRPMRCPALLRRRVRRSGFVRDKPGGTHCGRPRGEATTQLGDPEARPRIGGANESRHRMCLPGDSAWRASLIILC